MDHQKVGLMEYRNFTKELMMRYPGYVIQDSIELYGLEESYPSCLRRSIDEIPESLHPYTEKEYLPQGIKEIKEILQKNLHVSLGNVEKSRSKKSGNENLEKIGQLYSMMYPTLGRTISILLKILYSVIVGSNLDFSILKSGFNSFSKEERMDFIQGAIKERVKSVLCKAVSGILLILLKIFKIHHILEFEHFCAILVEQNCQLIFLKLLVSWFPSPATFLKKGSDKNIVGEIWLKQKEEIVHLE